MDGSSPPVLPTPSSCPPVIQISSSGLGVGGGEGKGDDVGRKGGRRRRGEEEEEWEGEELMGGGRRGCRQVQVRQAELLVHLIAGIRHQFGPFIFLSCSNWCRVFWRSFRIQ